MNKENITKWVNKTVKAFLIATIGYVLVHSITVRHLIFSWQFQDFVALLLGSIIGTPLILWILIDDSKRN